MRFFQKKERVGGMLVISSLSGKKWFNLLITMTKIMLEFQCSGTFTKKKSVFRTSDQWCYVFVPLPIYLEACSLKQVADLLESMQFEILFFIHSLSPGEKIISDMRGVIRSN